MIVGYRDSPLGHHQNTIGYYFVKSLFFFLNFFYYIVIIFI